MRAKVGALLGGRKAPCGASPFAAGARLGYARRREPPVSRASLALSALPGAAVLALAAGPALAGEAACWFENNVVVVPAEVMGVAGDYILDTATPHTILADSQAQTAGYAETALNGEVRLAGLTLRDRPVQVLAIDLRTGALPTPIAGVIGADVMRGFVLDVSFAPCRMALRPKAPNRFVAQVRLPMAWLADRPVVRAAVADGPDAFVGAFAVAIGADTAVRLSDGLAKARTAKGAAPAKPKELYPYGVLRPKLRALSFAGRLSENLPAGLIAAEDPALAGQIGAPLLAAYRLRFDFPRGELLLAAAPATPPRKQGPAHGR